MQNCTGIRLQQCVYIRTSHALFENYTKKPTIALWFQVCLSLANLSTDPDFSFFRAPHPPNREAACLTLHSNHILFLNRNLKCLFQIRALAPK